MNLVRCGSLLVLLLTPGAPLWAADHQTSARDGAPAIASREFAGPRNAAPTFIRQQGECTGIRTASHAGDAIVNAIVNLPPDQLSARTTYEGSLFLAVDPLRESFGRAPPSLVFSN